MKIIKNVLTAFSFILLMTASYSATANGTPSDWKAKMATYLSDFGVNEDVPDRILVDFKINDNSEIEVISTSSKELEKKIMAKLNNKILKTKDLIKNKKYTLPIVFERA